MAKGTVETVLSEWLLVALIIFTLIFEYLLHNLEHWVHHHHHHLVAVMRVLYRELMILGVISLSFITYNLTVKPHGNVVLSFEFAHIFIFLLAIFYTAVVLSTMYLSLKLSARWKQMERMDLVHYLNMRDKYSKVRTVINQRSDRLWKMFWWFPNATKLYNYTKMHEVMAFHDIRFQFIYYRNLPDNFRFSSFLRKIKSTTFIELVESHWSLWVIFLGIVLCDILRRVITDEDDEDQVKDKDGKKAAARLLAKYGARFVKTTVVPALSAVMHAPGDGKEYVPSDDPVKLFDSIVIVCSAVFLAVFAQVLAFQIRYVYWRLSKHPRMYYEGVDANVVLEELQKLVDEREAIRKRRQRSRSLRDDTSQSEVDEDDEEELMYRGRISEAFAENELLDPMRPQPLHSPLHPSAAAAGVATTTSASAAAMADVKSATGSESGGGRSRPVSIDIQDRAAAAAAAINGVTTASVGNNQSGTDELIEIGMRHSLEYSRTANAAASAAEEQQAQRSMTDLDANTFSDDQDNTVRHSLDVPRSPVGFPPSQRYSTFASQQQDTANAPTPVSASIARAAVEAARRRGADTSDAEDMSQQDGGLQQPMSPRSPLMRSNRASIDEDDGMLRDGRVSIDSRGNATRRGGRISVELAVVMRRDELAAHFEEDEEEQARIAAAEDEMDDVSNSASNRASKDSRRSRGDGTGFRFNRKRGKNGGGGATDDEQTQQRIPMPMPPAGEVHVDLDDEVNKEKDVDDSATATTGNGNDDDDAIKPTTVSTRTGAALNRSGRSMRRRNTINATILKNFEEHRIAESRTPKNYPKLLTRLIPRLARVASPVEKLFWFGSHKFFLWCVTFVLFFSTVLLSASASGMALSAVYDRDIGGVQIAGFVLSSLNLIFVLLRIAVIIKRYIFILHNASLIPEVVALEAIQTVRSKRIVDGGNSLLDEQLLDAADVSSISGSETELDDEDVSRERRRLGRYFRSQARSGNIPGIDTSRNTSRSNSVSRARAAAAVTDDPNISGASGISIDLSPQLGEQVSGRRSGSRKQAEMRRRKRLSMPFFGQRSSSRRGMSDQDSGMQNNDLTIGATAAQTQTAAAAGPSDAAQAKKAIDEDDGDMKFADAETASVTTASTMQPVSLKGAAVSVADGRKGDDDAV